MIYFVCSKDIHVLVARAPVAQIDFINTRRVSHFVNMSCDLEVRDPQCGEMHLLPRRDYH